MISKRLTTISLVSFIGSAGCALASAETSTHVAEAGPTVSPKAYELFEFMGIPFTNAMLTGWVMTFLIIIGIRMMTGNGKPSLVPTKGQAIIESMIGFVKDMIEPIVGKRMVKPTLPFLIAIFVFVLLNNWSGLIPGVGAFGRYNEHGHLLYWFRPTNSDMNTTTALGLIGATVAWLYYVLRYAGLKALLMDTFGNKADASDMPRFLYLALTPLFIGIGCIEVFSIILRNLSLSVRLYGNVYGGEMLISTMNEKFPFHDFFIPLIQLPFYGLETLIGFVQALVFMLLCAVYIGLICNHGDEAEAH
jgi:F-type H+-transporting ATPase subunit a